MCNSPSFSASASPSPRGKLRTCCIPSCGQQASALTRLFRFPSAETSMLKWLVNTQQQPRFVDAQRLFVCQDHFEAEAICKNQLRSWAVPTLNLGHDGHIIPNAKHNGNIADSQENKQTLQFIWANYCSVLTCFQQSSEQLRLYQYPTDRPTIRKWAANCKHRSMQASSDGFQVCQSHFTPDCFDPDTGELKEDAVPTLALSRSVTEVRCVVNGCVKDEDASRRRLFKMLKRNPQILDWCHNLRLDQTTMSGSEQHVCERHFEANCFNASRVLRPGARPTLHLGHEDLDDVIPNPANWEEDVIVCCVPHCESSKDADEVQLFGLPKVRQLADKWLQNVHLDPSKEQLAGLKICSVHFEASCMENGRPSYGAMPTLHLGHDELDNIHPSVESVPTQQKRYCNRDGASHDCCYPQCVELQKSYLRVTYELPQEQELRQQWLSYMGLEAQQLDKQQLPKLCPLHLILLYDHSADHFSAHAAEELLDSNYEAARSSVRIRVVSCAVRGCRTLKPRDGGRLHGLPTRRDLLEMWLHNMQLVFYEQQRYMYKICSKHFESTCFTETTKRLKPWSMPTLELPERQPGEMPAYQNPTELEWQHMNELQVSEKVVEAQPEPLLKLEPLPKKEPPPPQVVEYEEDCDNNSQQPLEMQALEVLLEVGHVEKCTTYEQMDTEANLNYAEQFSHNPLSPGPPQCRIPVVQNGLHYSARHCSVHGCNVTSNNLSSSIKLHKFPVSLDAMQKWMHNTQVLVDVKFAWRFRICSHHFIDDCFHGSRIRRGAMPTLRLGSRRPKHIYDNEFNAQLQLEQSKEEAREALSAPLESQQQLLSANVGLLLPRPAPPCKSSKYCQIEGCSNHLTSENVTLHKFPHSSDMCAKWQHNTQVPFDPEFRWRYRICSAHFEPICLGNVRLMHGSVPTLNLGPLAPKKLFDNEFLRLDKPMSSSELGMTVKQEQMEQFDQMELEDGNQEQDDFSLLEPELQLHEDSEDEQQYDNHFSQNDSYNWSDQQLRLPSSNQEKCTTIYNPVKSGYDKCSLVHCQRQRSQHGVHIYKFPRSRQLQQRWMHNLRIQYDERRPWKTMICSVHFEPHCIRLRKLRPWAVPTLELGDNVPLEIFTNEQSQQLFAQSEAGSECDDVEVDVEDTILEDLDDDYDDNDADVNVNADDQMRTAPYVKRERRSRFDPLPPGQLPPWKIKCCCLPYCRSPRGDGIKLFRLPNNISSIRKWEQATGMRFYESQRNTKLICSRHFDPQLIGVRRLMSNAVPSLHLGPDSAEPELPPVGPRCCMPDCSEDVNVQLHKFPKDPMLLHQWCQALNLPDVQSYSGKFICAAHLPSNAMSCLICGVDDVQLPMLDFPQNRNQRTKWCYNLKIEPLPKWDNSKQICCKHFESFCFIQPGQLLAEALPTLHLEHGDSNIFLNDEAMDNSKLLRVKDEPMESEDLML
ncbi:GH13048 [Drosophila grimshawi]|uniref:GH13048 n=2 Tax=Drosophila grimshawi TaxID=7222 RepID=B4JR68_DROGR|nr:GH13048 [Drosophila grimshawi]